MPVTIDSTLFDLLPPPQFGQYSITRMAPKVTFQSANGYKHQREAFSSARYRFVNGWNALTVAQYNTLMAWLDYAGSGAFYYVVPDTEAFAGMSLTTRLVRIVDEETEITPFDKTAAGEGFYRVRITLEDL